jgi:ATP-dependent RNA helicase DDX46/PRP5
MGGDSSPEHRERRRERKQERGERRAGSPGADRRARDKERSRQRSRSRSRSRGRGDRDRDRRRDRDRVRARAAPPVRAAQLAPLPHAGCSRARACTALGLLGALRAARCAAHARARAAAAAPPAQRMLKASPPCARRAQDGGKRARSRSHSRSRSRGDAEGEDARAKRRRSASPGARALTAEEEEAAAQARRDEEQAKLDAEMERRRKRVELWQQQRRAQLAAAEGGAGGAGGEGDGAAGAAEGVCVEGGEGEGEGAEGEGAEAAPRAKGWTLDGDDDEEEEEDGAAAAEEDAAGEPPKEPPGTQSEAAPATQPPDVGGTPAAAAAATPMEADAVRTQPDEAEEVDPLDAFMAAQVMPEVARLRQEDAYAYAQEAAEYAQAAAAPVPPPLAEEVEEVDPLDAFMAANSATAQQQQPPPLPPPAAPPPDAPARAGRPGLVVRSSSFKGLIIKPPTGGAPAGGAAAPAPAASSRPAGFNAAAARGALRRAYGGGDTSSSSEAEGDSSDDDEAWAKKAMAGKASKVDKLGVVDHAAVEYVPFRKAFYIESAEIARMSEPEVAAMRKGALEGVKCRGKDVPRPVKSWTQAGLSQKVLDVLAKLGHETPLPIQAQALPIIMSGRDCIGIAKTGSGKTLAFLLPLLRHAKDQPPLAQGDGMIGLIMAPTRELVTQIAKDAKRFAHAVGLSVACIYGGSGVAAQIGELKRGAEIVVCTPGRLIDILASSRVTNLRRVTYLVLDEADRMFDMGFEPQISRIIGNTRPDRQTVMFSATFPHAMELLARNALQAPVEIQVGGRSVVNPDIEQYIEIRPESERFLRLLELLGQWYEAGKILVFVHTQDKCDAIFRDLLRAGYPCLSLHGGKEQSDRESTIADFKSDVCNVLVATSVAARGLDVKALRLVVNYDVPNHHEDYVHRCGRTGRAGAKGTAVTFIGPDEERYAPDLVKALKESGRPVPEDLAALADAHMRARKAGTAQAHGSGFGGSGFKFDTLEDGKTKAERKAQAIEYGADTSVLGSSSDEEEEAAEAPGAGIVQTRGAGAVPQPQPGAPGALPPAMAAAAPPMSAAQQQASGVSAAQAAAVASFQAAAAAKVNASMAGALALVPQGGAAAAAAAARAGFGPGALMPIGAAPIQQGPLCPPPGAHPAYAAAAAHTALQAAAAAAAALTGPNATPAQRAAAFAASLNATARAGGAPGMMPPGFGAGAGGVAQQADHFELEIEINDFPQHARWKVTHKDSLREISDFTGAAITTRGQYVPPGKPPGAQERKLYLLVEGPTERSVREAKLKIREILEAAAAKEVLPGGFGGGQMPGRYSVL